MKIKVASVDNNPYRSFEANPLDQLKVDGLKESIESTEFWDNLVLRKNPDAEGRYQLAYGHHRVEALKQLGVEDMDVPVKDIDDDTMLKMMSIENKSDWGSSILVMLETVRQVRNTLADQVGECENFDEYSEKFNFFLNSGDFGNAKKQGVGYRKVREFLGETWSENDIKYAVAAINSMEAGMITMADIQGITSISILNRFTIMIKQIMGLKETPLYLKELWISGLIERVNDADNAPSVKNLTRTRDIINKGCDPLMYLDSGKHNNIDVTAILVKLLEDEAEVDFAVGFEGFEDLVTFAKDKLAKKLDKQSKREAGEEVEDEAADDLAEAEAEAESLTVPDDDIEDMGDLGDIGTDSDGKDIELNVPKLMGTFIGSVGAFSMQCRRLFGRDAAIAEVESDDFSNAIVEVYKHVTVLVLEHFGKDEAKTMIDEFEQEYLNKDI